MRFQLEAASSSNRTSLSASYFSVDPLDFDAWAPVAIIASVLLMMVPGLILYTTVWCSSRQTQETNSPVSTAQRVAMQWLACLAIASIFLLRLQVGLGRWAHSLSLLADSAHSMADCAMYCFAFFLEFVKLRFGEAHTSQNMVRWLDRISGFFSITVMMLTTIMVTVQALMRLQTRAPALGRSASEDNVGRALLTFSALTLVVNAGLFCLQYVWSQKGKDDGEASTMPGPPECQGESKQNLARAVEESRGEQDSNDAGCSKEVESEQPSAWGRIAGMVHTFLHPGCSSSADEQCSSGENFNLTGVNLHLLTDLSRTFLMLATGVLVECHIVSDQAQADAACACMVCVCVVVGGFTLLSTFFDKAPQSEACISTQHAA